MLKLSNASQCLIDVAGATPLPGPPGVARPSPSSEALPGPPDARVQPPGQLPGHSPCCIAGIVMHCRCWLVSLMHSIQSGLVCKQKWHGNVNWACLLWLYQSCLTLSDLIPNS